MLFSRGAVLFGIEATPGEAVALTAADDAMLVDEPNYNPDMQKIERNFSKGDLSPFPFMIGRKLATVTFKHEIRSNGKATGLTADAPKLAKLFRACGFSLETAANNEDRISPIVPGVENVGDVTWVKGGDAVNDEVAMFDIRITTAGNAAAAMATVTCNNPNVQAAPATDVPLSAAITLGNTGSEITPTVNEDVAVGDRFTVVVFPQGVKLVPVTDGFETATLEVYYDGLKHKLLGAVGTFSFSAEAGGIVVAEFTFMGIHQPVVDAPFPADLVFEEKLPALFQSALVTYGKDHTLVVKAVSFDLSLEAGVRDDANSATGFRGYTLSSRSPQGGFTPEAVPEAQHAFWGEYEAADQKAFFARIGTDVGNTVSLFGPRAQTSQLGYTDNNNQRSYEVGMGFARYKGNDEVMFHFG